MQGRAKFGTAELSPWHTGQNRVWLSGVQVLGAQGRAGLSTTRVKCLAVRAGRNLAWQGLSSAHRAEQNLAQQGLFPRVPWEGALWRSGRSTGLHTAQQQRKGQSEQRESDFHLGPALVFIPGVGACSCVQVTCALASGYPGNRPCPFCGSHTAGTQPLFPAGTEHGNSWIPLRHNRGVGGGRPVDCMW